MLALLRSLKSISATPEGSTRLGYSPEEDQAHEVVWNRLKKQGSYRRIDDPAGNLFVLPANLTAGSKVVLIGSHLDTVRRGGWLDGALGVVAGVVTLEKSRLPLKDHLGLVVFRDEEGVRFGNGLFGSRALAGGVTSDELNLTDVDGAVLGDLVPDLLVSVRYTPPVTPAAYLECHIEQGARLEATANRIGLVQGFVGIRRLDLRCRGEANHAGTTEMSRRVDALVPVAELIARLPALVEDQQDTVITCGQLDVTPGSPNVVPGEVSAVIEIRSLDSAVIDLVETRVRTAAESMTATKAQVIRIVRSSNITPVRTDPRVMELCGKLVRHTGHPSLELPSMAGHDAQALSGMCPVGMFFVPSIGGISHSPGENSAPDDIEAAGRLMSEWAETVVRFTGLVPE